MRFLINSPRKRKAVKRRRATLGRKANGQFVKRAKSARRRVRRTQGQTQSSGGSTVAKRRRRRRSVVRHAAPRRRRRRAVVRLASNPRRRRRRTAVARHHTTRRRYRRNPGGTGVVATIKQGVKDGALILVGQAAQGRVAAIVGKVVPIGGLPGAVITDVGSAVAITMLARKFSPANARMIAGGAFANAVRRVVAAVSPGTAALLGDGGDDYLIDGQPGVLSAWPDQQLGAYPGGLGDSADDHVVYS